ncbi:MFS general substrate transporter [Stereum hirsutum FP-91666 SS1]|uniref:MFS general substrate transporter n=1 Tax=Stereum hirsutum (strain FP-91666) TaxID=721885 RepID=UPI000440D7A7|nr:MFS general substrate transporter [Stereum hirsutum FP-91666 SS1]EIM90804.1 MFS general substrate transporter [Stereum hirsutum FP-91666 SS1]
MPEPSLRRVHSVPGDLTTVTRRVATSHDTTIVQDEDNTDGHSQADEIRAAYKQIGSEKDRRREGDKLELGGYLPGREERTWQDNIVTWDSPDDPQNPQNWSSSYKILVTILYGSITMCSSFSSSIFGSGSSGIIREYGISSEVAVLGTSLFILGYVPGPIVFAPLSELYGRRLAVLIPMFIFTCFSAATATAKDVQTIYITRFFGGLMASAPVVNVGGGLADMFNQRQRAGAVVLYALTVVGGPLVGPIIGSAVSNHPSLGWRWCEYLVVILTGTIISINAVFLPETYGPALLSAKAKELRLRTGRWELHSRQEMQEFTLGSFVEKNLTRPLRMLALEPMVFVLTLYNSFTYGILYLFFSAIPIIYEEGRGWNPVVGSLPFLAVLVGCVSAAGFNMWFTLRVFIPHMEKHEGRARPEMRLPPMMLGGITFPVGFFILGWTANPNIHWFPGMIGLTLIGASFLLIFQAGINYLLDAYTKYTASAIAANTLMRSMFGAGLPLVAIPMFNRLGVAWTCTLLGCIAVLLAVLPFEGSHFNL